MSVQEAVLRVSVAKDVKDFGDNQLRLVKSARILDVEDVAEIEQKLLRLTIE
ncbi:hypothetical protein [Corynebacterium atypicum]|uniref:hypothetical protein n=1 Tax=Corynebacterium atypicum TaxID=191610 RepID=UPI0012B5505D|nr:hypothetical protein [Corynebacterium atypicum]